jgi:hypothetical protein
MDAATASTSERFVFEGLEAALGWKTQENRRRKISAGTEARVIAIACSEPPE